MSTNEILFDDGLMIHSVVDGVSHDLMIKRYGYHTLVTDMSLADVEALIGLLQWAQKEMLGERVK